MVLFHETRLVSHEDPLAENGLKDYSLKIMKDIGSHCQVIFSATYNESVKEFARKIVGDYNEMLVSKEELSLGDLKQYKVRCPKEVSKILVIKYNILESGDKVGQTIIFFWSRDSARSLHTALVDYGYEVTTIQGSLGQDIRDKIVKEFKDGLTQVNVVVNYDLPVKYGAFSEPDYEVYLHRIGRAGRFDRNGAVFNLLSHYTDNTIMEKIENYFGVQAGINFSHDDEAFEEALRDAGLL